MIKVKLKSEIERIELVLRNAKEEKKRIISDFISEFCPFEIGDKVKITDIRDNIHLAFVKDVKVCSLTYNLEYYFFACKKDGTVSRNHLYLRGFKSIEKND